MHNFYDRRSPASLLHEWARTGHNVDNFRFEIDDARYARWAGLRAKSLMAELLLWHEHDVLACDREAAIAEIRHYARMAAQLALAAVGYHDHELEVS